MPAGTATRRWGVAVAMTVLLALGAGPPATAAATGTDSAVTPLRGGELVEKIPISKRPWGAARSVMSFGPDELGTMRPGEVVEAAADVELTICVRGHPCVGRHHAYDPRIKLRLVLGRTARATAHPRTIDVSRVYRFGCTERRGHRTRHCAQQIGWARKRITARTARICTACHLNLVVSAFHPRARRGEKVVVGTSDKRRRIRQGRAQLSAAVHDAGASRPKRTWTSTSAVDRTPPVVPKARPFRWAVVYSKRLRSVRRWDQLLIDATAITSTGRVPYPTHLHHSIVLSRSRRGTVHDKTIADRVGPIGIPNGYTCTKVTSGHQSPCRTTKTGIVSIENARGPIYVNLIAGQEARGAPYLSGKWKRSHTTRILRGGGVRVRRYSGSMSCSTCVHTAGFIDFDRSSRSEFPYIDELLRKLRARGVSAGSYLCGSRRKPPHIYCRYRYDGAFGGTSPPYRCELRAFYRRGSRWALPPCKSEVASMLWRVLESRRGVLPSAVGRCARGHGRARKGELGCRWSGRHALVGYRCEGFGYYEIKARRWRVEPCVPLSASRVQSTSGPNDRSRWSR